MKKQTLFTAHGQRDVQKRIAILTFAKFNFNIIFIFARRSPQQFRKIEIFKVPVQQYSNSFVLISPLCGRLHTFQKHLPQMTPGDPDDSRFSPNDSEITHENYHTILMPIILQRTLPISLPIEFPIPLPRLFPIQLSMLLPILLQTPLPIPF